MVRSRIVVPTVIPSITCFVLVPRDIDNVQWEDLILATTSSSSLLSLQRRKGSSLQPVSSPDEFDRHGPDAPANPMPLPSPFKATSAVQPIRPERCGTVVVDIRAGAGALPMRAPSMLSRNDVGIVPSVPPPPPPPCPAATPRLARRLTPSPLYHACTLYATLKPGRGDACSARRRGRRQTRHEGVSSYFPPSPMSKHAAFSCELEPPEAHISFAEPEPPEARAGSLDEISGEG
ncbi:hypothetical protein GGF50DRAFT_92956 [Schizophyllum commune]